MKEYLERWQVGFNAKQEVNYLNRLPVENRRSVLKMEIATAAAETHRFSFTNWGHPYYWDGEVIDPKSGELLSTVVGRGGRIEEEKAFSAIERGLAKEDGFLLHISPPSNEYHYPVGVVDLWNRQGHNVLWQRVTVENNSAELREIFSTLSGQEVASEAEILTHPVFIGSKDKIADVLNLFRVKDDTNKLSQEEIEMVTTTIIDDFDSKFGKDFINDPNTIFRLFSAVVNETEIWLKEKVELAKRKMVVTGDRLYTYAFEPMQFVFQKNFVCDMGTMIGQFSKRVGNFINNIVGKVTELFAKTFDCPKCHQSIPSGKGIEVCPHCGAKKSDYGSTCD